MAAEASTLPLETFRKLSPINGLRGESLEQLHKRCQLRTAGAGAELFKIGSSDADSYYLISGKVSYLDPNGKVLRELASGTPEALHRLAHQVPRKVTAVCQSAVQYIKVDSSLLDVMLTWDQTGSFEVGELKQQEDDSANEDWMTRLLQMRAFQRVPPANLQAMFMRMQQINASAGEAIISQGDDGDYFYVLVTGRAIVTRETPTSPKPIKLAEFAAGACFGEEALISDAKRNATIRMLENGTLMRLAKEDFQALLNAPLTRKMTVDKARSLVEADKAKWLDVRLPSEFKNQHLDGALNLPLYMLRPKLAALSKDMTYVVCCDSGRRSSVAAFVLTQKGFDAYVLDGGIEAAA